MRQDIYNANRAYAITLDVPPKEFNILNVTCKKFQIRLFEQLTLQVDLHGAP